VLRTSKRRLVVGWGELQLLVAEPVEAAGRNTIFKKMVRSKPNAPYKSSDILSFSVMSDLPDFGMPFFSIDLASKPLWVLSHTQNHYDVTRQV